MTTYRNLGQVAPAATTATTLYTAAGPVVCSTVAVCNRGAAGTTFRLAHRVGGAALSNEMYVFYDTPIGANSTAMFTLGMCMSNTDVLTCYATLATVSFNAWGVEAP